MDIPDLQPPEDTQDALGSILFTYERVSYGFIVAFYSCGDVLPSDCLSVPLHCQRCGAPMLNFDLYPHPHPEIIERIVKE